MDRDELFRQAAADLGYSFDGELKIGGNYVPLLRSGNQLYVSGQIPRVGDTVVVTGRAGSEVPLAQAQLAAKVCVMRALALLQRSLGSLASGSLKWELMDMRSPLVSAVVIHANIPDNLSVKFCF